MTARRVRAISVAVLAGLTLLPSLIQHLTAPANYGAHGLTTGFGRGRLDLQGIVSEGAGSSVDLPEEPLVLTVRLSGGGPIHLRGDGAERDILASEVPVNVRLNLPRGGRVSIESSSRFRLHELVLERGQSGSSETVILVVLALLAVAAARQGGKQAATSALLFVLSAAALMSGRLSGAFARIVLAQLWPAAVLVVVFLPLALALRQARVSFALRAQPLTLLAFVSSLVVSGLQFALFEQPRPMGDPAAYLEMGGKFADAMAHLGSPLGLGPILSDLQPYLALPATGVLYGVLSLIGGLKVIYAAQAFAMAVSVAGLVSICQSEIGARAARIALIVALVHPSFSILPGIVQPEPFILAAWTIAALVSLRAVGDAPDPRGFLGAGILLGAGLALHPQGLSFLLLALILCLLPWMGTWLRRPLPILSLLLGVFTVLLPVAAAERFSKPLAYVLDRQYGFFAYTSPHPLGFWLYVDSDGWQGPLRIEDTTYQKELIAQRGEGATSSTFADVAAFVARHPTRSAQTVLTNLHRLWHQPDNPFALPFVLPYPVQVLLQRGLVVLFVLGLPALLGGRLALVALPFVMLSMTYPAYHIFNKYGTPALPFTIIGASLVLDRLLRERGRLRFMIAGLGAAALGALAPASFFAGLGVSGEWFLPVAFGLVWAGLALALTQAIRVFEGDLRSRLLSGAVGVTVLLLASFAASLTDTSRGVWSASLDQPFEVTCRLPPGTAAADPQTPAWILIDAEARDAQPPHVELNGRALSPPSPTMPTFGLATFRGRRDPAAFRQLWRTRVEDEALASGEIRISLRGGEQTRVFGDIRRGSSGPRLSLGTWPYLSVYRLVHEGQYRLPIMGGTPPQACEAAGMSGRPGIFLVRVPVGEEANIGLRIAKPVRWIF